MRHFLYAVLDSKLGEFNTPVCFPSPGVAQRAFQDEVNRVADTNPMNKYPDDFSFYCVGEYETSTGVVDPLGVPKLLARASDLIIR